MRDLFFLSAGTLDVPQFAFGPSFWVAPWRRQSIPVTVAVLVRDNGDVLLVDAGWSEAECSDPRRTLGPVSAWVNGLRPQPGASISAQLPRHGIQPDRVVGVIATHMHLDHIGGLCDFPNAELLATEIEIDAFRNRASLGYIPRHLRAEQRLRPLRVEQTPAYGFPASHDLYGDGEVVLLDARGHTKGSIAVALRDKSRAYVHIGDAVYQGWELSMPSRPPSVFARMASWKNTELVRTHAAIRACEADPRRPVIVPSHDAAIFATLPRVPAGSSATLHAPPPS